MFGYKENWGWFYILVGNIVFLMFFGVVMIMILFYVI